MTKDRTPTAKVSDGATTPADSSQPASFEDGLTRLAELVGGLESGRLGLAESIAAYEQGVSLVRHLHAELADVEQRVKTLMSAAKSPSAEDNLDGDPDAEGVPRAASEGGDGASRKGGAKRTAERPSRGTAGRPRRLPGMDDPSPEV